MRLVRAVLAEQHDERIEGGRYINLEAETDTPDGPGDDPTDVIRTAPAAIGA